VEQSGPGRLGGVQEGDIVAAVMGETVEVRRAAALDSPSHCCPSADAPARPLCAPDGARRAAVGRKHLPAHREPVLPLSHSLNGFFSLHAELAGALAVRPLPPARPACLTSWPLCAAGPRT
jgi:hypothetical protein